MRYLLGLLIAVGLVVLVFILILRAFGSHSNTPIPHPLIDYANTNVTVQMTIDGVINADQDHQSLEINIGQNQSTIDIYQGYQGVVTTTQSYPNNQSAYAVFLRAIDLQGFTKGNSNPAFSDDRGYCPDGNRFTFAIVNGGQDVQHYWATSCGGQGTFKGNVSTIENLFTLQIPNYNQLTNNLSNLF